MGSGHSLQARPGAGDSWGLAGEVEDTLEERNVEKAAECPERGPGAQPLPTCCPALPIPWTPCWTLPSKPQTFVNKTKTHFLGFLFCEFRDGDR